MMKWAKRTNGWLANIEKWPNTQIPNGQIAEWFVQMAKWPIWPTLGTKYTVRFDEYYPRNWSLSPLFQEKLENSRRKNFDIPNFEIDTSSLQIWPIISNGQIAE